MRKQQIQILPIQFQLSTPTQTFLFLNFIFTFRFKTHDSHVIVYRLFFWPSVLLAFLSVVLKERFFVIQILFSH